MAMRWRNRRGWRMLRAMRGHGKATTWSLGGTWGWGGAAEDVYKEFVKRAYLEKRWAGNAPRREARHVHF